MELSIGDADHNKENIAKVNRPIEYQTIGFLIESLNEI